MVSEDIGDISMNDTLADFASVLGGVVSCPLAKAVAGICLWGCTVLGLPVDLVYVMCAMFVGDFVLGMVLAFSRHEFSLRRFARGFAKVPVYTLFLAIAWLCQFIVKSVLGQTIPVPLWVCSYLAMHDAMSILVKCEELDFPIPKSLKRILKRVNKGVDKHVESILDIVDKPEGKKK